jgi:HEAT repeat protein
MLRGQTARSACIVLSVIGMAAFITFRATHSGAESDADSRTVEELMDALRDRSAEVRADAATGLMRHGPEAIHALAPLLTALGDSSAVVRANAAAALGRLGPRAEDALIRALGDSDPQMRRGAAIALRVNGQAMAAVPALARHLGDDDPGVRLNAARMLSRIGPCAEPYLLNVLSSGAPAAREAAADALSEAEWVSAAAVPTLLISLAEPEEPVGEFVVKAFKTIGPNAVPELVAKLSSSDPRVRRRAACALGKLGPAASAAIGPLTRGLADYDCLVRANAAEALGRIGCPNPAIVAGLHALVNDSEPLVRRTVREALLQLDPEHAPPPPRRAPPLPDPVPVIQ